MTLLRALGHVANYPLGILGLRLSRLPSSPEVWHHERAPELLHSRFFVDATYSPWLSDNEFLNAYKKIKDFTMVKIERCYELWDLGKQSTKTDGAIVEVGVWRGGTGSLLAMSAPMKSVYLADTFDGVVKAGKNDNHYVGGEHANTSLEIVSGLLASARVNNVTLLKGIFPEETATAIKGQISLLHVDVDVYESASNIIDWALPRLPVGAKIVFDDYGFYECAGVTRLVNELRRLSHGFDFVYNLNGHAILIRTCML